jgi:hypothetical protein
MGWETRQRGGRYYTRSRREEGRVVREYLGTGPVAEAIATLDRIDRRDRINARDEARLKRQQYDEIDALVQTYFNQVEEKMREVLNLAGYHRPKRGQWRKRRCETR